MLYQRIRAEVLNAIFSSLLMTLVLLGHLELARAAEPIRPGETVSGDLNAAGKVDTWTFEAKAGDAIVVRAGEWIMTSDIRPRLQVTAPDGSSASSDQGFDDVDVSFTAKASGTFTIKIDASLASGRGSYRLTLGQIPATLMVSAGDQGGEIGKGELKAGNLYVGDMDFYTVSADAGDELVFRVGEVAALPDMRPRLRVYGPTGVQLGAGQGFEDAEVAVRATNSGPFIVIVDASLAGGSGDYRLSVSKSRGPVTLVAGDEGGEISNGEIRRGTLLVGDLDVYTFSATAGDQLVVRAGETNIAPDIRPRLRLYGPSGAFLGDQQGFDDAELTALATNTGVYTIVLSASLAGGSGGYWLNFAKSTGPVSVSEGDEGGAILNGELKEGNLFVGDLDLWTFDAVAGDRIIVRVGENKLVTDMRPRVRLYGPSGVLVAGDQGFDDAEISAVATNSGPFLIVVNSSFERGSGTYRLSMTKSTGDVVVSAGDEGGVIENGETKLGQLAPGDVDVFTFNAVQGERFVVRLGEASLISDIRPRMRVVGPNGDLLASDQGFDDLELTAKVTVGGKHSILVSGAQSGAAGTYLVNYVRVPADQVVSLGDQGGAIRNGETKNGELKPGDVDGWTFLAVANQTVVVRVGEMVPVGDIRPHVRLFDPTGALMADEASFDGLEILARITNSGLHTIVISGGVANGAGTYQVHLFQSPGAVFTSDNDEGGLVVGTENKMGSIRFADLDPWLFTSCTSDRLSLTLTVKSTTGGLVPRLRLFGRDGSVLTTKTGGSAGGASVTLTATTPVDGTYALVVSDGNSSGLGTGDYEIQFGGLSAGIKLCRPSVAGGLVTLTGAGADPGQTYVLTTSQDLSLPSAQWEPISTNLFGQFGEMFYRGEHRKDISVQYFKLRFE